MLRVKDEEYSMSKGRDYQDGELSEDYSDNELELYQQYCAGKYGDHSTVPASPHFHSTLQSNTKDLFTKLPHLDIMVKLLETRTAHVFLNEKQYKSCLFDVCKCIKSPITLLTVASLDDAKCFFFRLMHVQ